MRKTRRCCRKVADRVYPRSDKSCERYLDLAKREPMPEKESQHNYALIELELLYESPHIGGAVGEMNTIRPDSLPIRVLTKICDLMLLNLLFILTCATVVFSGTGLAALYAVTLKMVRGKDYAPLKGFVRAARGNFIPSVLATILLFLDGTLIAYLCYVLYADTLLVPPELFVLLTIAALLFTAVLSWLFPLLAGFDNTFLHHLTNAAKLVNLLPLLLALLFPRLLGQFAAFWLLIGLAAGAFINSFYLSRIFDAKGN